ncbi:MAG: 2-oxoglutarate dehydrogenase E1 component [Candidatus Parabeggiatoa sp. nov. 3]|nr:MAG: 2-oxoglutarate dehydrogenase E1 component [Gammaproteobacteria bacterium]RKZ89097.1 MAG: 2-oxoglutarate dehydrogenase E1 component [Gammaproteobacteria bacterium]HEW98961.1 2-oxoglutarate dehydrogenase E1 component [Beggiatoa sp.]
MNDHSYLYNAAFIDDLYEAYLVNPLDVSEEWREYFAQLQQEEPLKQPEMPHAPIRAALARRLTPHYNHFHLHQDTEKTTQAIWAKKQSSVLRLINAYRFRGHQHANLEPLNLQARPDLEELYPEYYGLTQTDLSKVFYTGSLYGVDYEKLSDILKRIQTIYCGSIGAEYMHITDTEQKRWIQQRLEGTLAKPNFLSQTKRNILERLTAAQGLEEYLHRKYVGQKRFSLEGGESLIPLFDQLIQQAGGMGVQEIIIGMAHRGRLNVLVNVLGKRPIDIFSEFEGKTNIQKGSGDVKYHLGFSSDVMTPGGLVHLAMAFNPSHLEIINPVVEGAVRARQERYGDKQRNQVLPILIHGDAAFAGQGVIMETLNLSETHGYGTGGTVHIVINNQIGFTTSDPLDSRSTLYCTDVVKMVQAPIFHVNGDDPEAVLFVTKLALNFRMAFNKDVVVDMVCYRRYGHNESDDPFATQPVMYNKIKNHPKTQAIYAQRLIKEGIIEQDEQETLLKQYRSALETNEVVSRPVSKEFKHGVNWRPYIGTHWTSPAHTSLSQEKLQHLITQFTTIPEGFQLNRGVSRLIEARRKMAKGELPLDWGSAETLAYATLLEMGYPVRLSGQDSARGTFAHRHAVFHDQNTGETYLPLQHLSDKQAKFLVINSLLSEAAVLGFEYGYSASEPETLVIWEAQFGDFANNAQVVIDQFISSSESKWQRYSALVMFLPHGYNGQGPEHSSARIERYLQLCAEDNIQVCVPSTPAQFFHLIVRQMRRAYRKPLIVMTPKSLLRHKMCVSHFKDFTEHGFQIVIDETEEIDPQTVERLIFCSGKVYFELLEARQEQGIDNIAIVRLEQLYPYPKKRIDGILDRYPHVKQYIWTQEEPRNQGAWWYMRAHMEVTNLSHREVSKLEYIGRPPSASPATGDFQVHREQRQAIITEVLSL